MREHSAERLRIGRPKPGHGTSASVGTALRHATIAAHTPQGNPEPADRCVPIAIGQTQWDLDHHEVQNRPLMFLARTTLQHGTARQIGGCVRARAGWTLVIECQLVLGPTPRITPSVCSSQRSANKAFQRAYQPVRCRDVGWSGFSCILIKGAGHGGKDFADVVAGHQVAARAEVGLAVGEAVGELAGGGDGDLRVLLAVP